MASYGAQISNLYSASVPVASQLASERGAGFNEAFMRVLVKVSGQPQRVVQDGFAASWLPAEPYVQTFSYRENPAYTNYLKAQQERQQQLPAAGEQSANLSEQATKVPVPDDRLKGLAQAGQQDPNRISPLVEANPPLPYLLEVSFAPSLVQEKMTSYGVPVWGSTRPSILVWIVVEKAGERMIVGAADAHALVAKLLSESEKVGVPLFLPVADLQDVSAVDVDDLWGLYSDAVDAASERYPSDAIAMVRVYQSGEHLWSGNWVLKQKQVLESSSIYDAELVSLSEALVASMAVTMSSHYAILKRPGEIDSTLDMEISQILTFEDYIGVQRYLKNLAPVSSAELKWVGNGRAAYHLVLRGSQAQFIEHIELGGKLKPGNQSVNNLVIDNEIGGASASAAAQFTWSAGR